MTTSLVRRLLGGMLAVLLVTAAGCSSPSTTATPAPAATTASTATKGYKLVPLTAKDRELMASGGMGLSGDWHRLITPLVSWYRKAAEQGDADTQFNLGVKYDDGLSVPQDYAQAASWYRKAAEQGDARAQFNLGAMYRNGQGVPQDYVESHKWRNLAASRASAEKQKPYAGVRDAMATLMTPQQLAEAQTLAREWLAAFEKRGGK